MEISKATATLSNSFYPGWNGPDSPVSAGSGMERFSYVLRQLEASSLHVVSSWPSPPKVPLRKDCKYLQYEIALAMDFRRKILIVELDDVKIPSLFRKLDSLPGRMDQPLEDWVGKLLKGVKQRIRGTYVCIRKSEYIRLGDVHLH